MAGGGSCRGAGDDGRGEWGGDGRGSVVGDGLGCTADDVVDVM